MAPQAPWRVVWSARRHSGGGIIAISDATSEVIRAVMMEIRVAWDGTGCRLVKSRRFEERQRLHLQSNNPSIAKF